MRSQISGEMWDFRFPMRVPISDVISDFMRVFSWDFRESSPFAFTPLKGFSFVWIRKHALRKCEHLKDFPHYKNDPWGNLTVCLWSCIALLKKPTLILCSDYISWLFLLANFPIIYFMITFHDYFPWSYFMFIFHDYVSWLYFMIIFHDHVSWLSPMIIFHDYISWLYFMILFHDYFPWSYLMVIFHD